MNQPTNDRRDLLHEQRPRAGRVGGSPWAWLASLLRSDRLIVTRLADILSIPIVRTLMIVLAVFVIDCLTPLGVAAGALYIAAVLSAVPMRRRRAVHTTAGVCSVLVFVGWIVSPGQGQTEFWKVLVNRSIDLAVIWASAGMADVWIRFQERQIKQVLETRLLHQATTLSASQVSFREALKNSLKTLCDIVGWPVGHVYVRDGSGQYLMATDVWHVTESGQFELLRLATRGARFSQGEGVVGQVWKSGEPIAIVDVRESSGYEWLKEPERLGVVGAFLLPVSVGGNVVAVMEFFSEQSIYLDSDFLPLARNVGNQLGRLFERRKAEHALRQSEERLRLALQGGCMGTWEWHIDTGQVIWSPELEEIHGLSPGMFEGTLEAVQREVHPEDRQRVTAAIEQVLEAGGEYRVEYRVLLPGGSVQWIEGRGAIHTDSDGQSRRLVGVCMNVTERKQFEEQNARLAAIVQSSDDAIVAKSLDGKVLSWNNGAERIYGYSAEEMIGSPISRLGPEGRRDDFAAIMDRIKTGGRLAHYETVRQRKDGRLIDISLSVSPIRNSDGEIIGASSVARDITERKVVEREMKEAREKAETASRLQSRFLANMSHELRTPMNAIIGMLQLALSDELTSEMRGWLETAKSSADTLLVLLNDLLDLSKMDAGKLAVQSEPYCLREVIDEMIRSLAPGAFEKRLELIYDVEADVPDQLVGDVFRLRQVLSNLVTNAEKFTDCGEIVVHVERGREADADVIRFSVTDTGRGISADDQRRVFEPFIQSDATAEQHKGGAGLGLSIARELVRRMGGELKVESTPGQGSRFWFDLPLMTDPDETSKKPACDDLRHLKERSVLVVDRNETNCQVLTGLLDRHEMHVDVGFDYDHALGKLYRGETERRSYDVMIIDAETAEMDGPALVAHLADSLDEVPAIVYMTRPGNKQYGEDDDDYEDQTSVAYLQKPVSPNRLASSVRQALGLEVCAEDAKPRSPLSQTASRALTILLAEDTPANQEVVSGVLSRRGHRVVVVNNGAEAVAAVDREAFDIVLMDVTMPVMDGYEATRAIRKRQQAGEPPLPVIALTAHAMQGDRETCMAAGMNAYLAKPIDVSRLIELVEDAALEKTPAGCGDERRQTPVDIEPAAHEGVVGGNSSQVAEIGNGDTWADEDGDAIIDYRGALKRLGGDESLFCDIVRLFDRDVPELLRRIRTCISEHNAAELQRAAHSLKGLAANFGAKDAVDSAYHLEQLGKSLCLDGAENAAINLENEVARLDRALSPYRATGIAEPEAPLA